MLTATARPAAALAPGDPARAERARRELTFLLQLAYSGELAATYAYMGHRDSLRDRTERAQVARIMREEVRHRHCLLEMLGELGAGPEPARERKMSRVGWAIAAFCRVGGWFFPMYGAARLEAQNIREYELAARLAHAAELHRWIDPFLEMAEVEWDHELYFRSQAMTHWLWKPMPKWPLPPPRPHIRGAFDEFLKEPAWAVPAVHPPRLVR